MILEFFTFDLWRSHMVEALGFAASGATLCAFAQKQMLPMRVSAIAASYAGLWVTQAVKRRGLLGW